MGLRRLHDGLGAGLMGNADAWQWWFDFPTKLLDVPLPRERNTPLAFDPALVLARNPVPLHPQPG